MFINKLISGSIIAYACVASVCVNASAQHQKKISITFDDVPIHAEFILPAQSVKDINHKLLQTLKKYNIKATGFVNEGHLKNDPQLLQSLLSDWHEHGHDLGNHTFSHMSYHKTDLNTYLADIQKGAITTQRVLGKQKQKFFRPPYLHAGDTPEAQHMLDKGLKESGLRLVPVTMENADYVFDAPYAAKLQHKQLSAATSYKQYLEFTEHRLDFYENASAKMFDQPVPHILMLHVNQLNADHLDSILHSLQSRGYHFQSLENTLEHPIYSQPTQAFKFGIHWLFRWDKSKENKVNWAKEPEPSAEAFAEHQQALTTLNNGKL
ncbi:MAG: polysaccharide deacetylase family protein [Gammaproteobacteria bacterium]|nr:polysaccharide deacetylase family protein [Gammaproteobacteria bacterium]MBU2057685.1 polysaccharide deacetylase family protein [Gammaproteobacteria bacterium]MBU2176386.1 polysaccharide deacetylase family protein [Gammaproteobacteria bacterium]MBU2343556.1 polysaccharide deacetylase family protein [Gammaproteobacteria bacterium]MBU2393342.1 polysaccharide deacetylase family protein [Gammaproteobacteria bacterium]